VGGYSDLVSVIGDTKQRFKGVANGAKQQAQAVKTKAAQKLARMQANQNAVKYAARDALGKYPRIRATEAFTRTAATQQQLDTSGVPILSPGRSHQAGPIMGSI
jgi:hypothetical protein